jgi:hypothetical protein
MHLRSTCGYHTVFYSGGGEEADDNHSVSSEMTTTYTAPSVESILEDSEDESRGELRGNDEEPPKEASHRQQRSSHFIMSPTRTNTGKEKERSRRKSTTSGSKHNTKYKTKNTSMKKAIAPAPPAPRDDYSDGSRQRHRRSHSHRSTSSASSSSDEDEPEQDHREILAARARLTSPSMISTFTSLTTSTNKSSGSSGSNSTVTQASITKHSTLGKRQEEPKPELPEVPMSPAVPDAPDVFAFLETGDDSEEDEEHDDAREGSSWPPPQLPNGFMGSLVPHHLSSENAIASSSSAPSSFHGSDAFSEPAHSADNDTDRSTSPERSTKGQSSDQEHDNPPADPTDSASVKIASQMAAAQQRQNLYSTTHQFGTPNMQRGTAALPHLAPSTLSHRYQNHSRQRSSPRAEKLPVTGYELLASRLSSYSSSGSDYLGEGSIKPMYRKFAGLNHRLLLHLQDEISELEEQLHRLDNADTQSRRAGGSGQVVPASRRAAAMQGGELQWHKTDVLGRIGYKLAQYSTFLPLPPVHSPQTNCFRRKDQALSSFNRTQSLSSPSTSEISSYREYLHTEHPIAEAETHFLDPEKSDDLVSICSSVPPSTSIFLPTLSTPSQSEASLSNSQEFQTEEETEEETNLPGLATAVAVAVLVPILTFSVIPGFLGRMTVTMLVALGVVGALMQRGVLDGRAALGKEGVVCVGIYGGVMAIVAGIVG